ncbi:MAG: proline--tRNA ligase [Acidimicrobiia bacterium]
MALPKQSEDFPAWYQAVVRDAGMAEPSLARGTMVIKPWGYAIWERLQRELDDRIKATGHENLYFPMFIPERLLAREAEHVEGFAPEVAVVTHGGGQKLEEPLVVRPTSETIIWETYGKWLQSWRDLPFMYNQWANVVRWELRPRVFLRTTEFLWQEGHTAHETEAEARAEADRVLHEVYADTVQNIMAMPVILGRKSEAERFPGAVDTLCMEALMRDGKALQAGTSHYLGQNFAKAYDVHFQSREGKNEYAYASSWGVSTRLIGGLIMTHGDDKGLRLPPRLAPQQVVIVPIFKADDQRASVIEAAQSLASSLRAVDVRVKVDDRDAYRPGYKFNEWELKGVPLRIELGPRDLEAGQAVVARRDSGIKETWPLAAFAEKVPALLDEIQQALFDEAFAYRDAHTIRPTSWDEMREYLTATGGFAIAPWDGTAETEAKVKELTKATIRCLPFDDLGVTGNDLLSGAPGVATAVFAQAY